jgi:hypothetical protein
MAEDEPTPAPIELRARWGDAGDVPLLSVNQVLGQVNEGEVFLTFGCVTPPVVLGSDEERRAAFEAIRDSGAVVEVRPVVRLFMTAQRLRQVVDVLTKTIEQHERQQQQAAGESAETDQ